MRSQSACALALTAFLFYSVLVQGFRRPLAPIGARKSPLRATKDEEDTRNVAEWATVLKEHRGRRFQVIAAEAWEDMALKLERDHPERFRFHATSWDHWPDGTDNIELGGFWPHNVISGSHVVFLANFESNAQTLSQFSVMITLLQSFVESLTVVLPFYPVGQMERITKPGQVATANTYAQLFSNLPSSGKPTRVMVYDIHALQTRFYVSGTSILNLLTTVPTVLPKLHEAGIDCIAFPDDGAAKRFKTSFPDFELITCGKTRDGDDRRVVIQEGSAEGRNVCIVDDLVQTGGTLFEAGKALMEDGALSVSCFVAHGVFPNHAWKRFARDGDRGGLFAKFWVTNSCISVTKHLPTDDCFEVLDIAEQLVQDIDNFG